MTTDNPPLPSYLGGAFRVTVTPCVAAAFQQNRQAGDEPRSGALLGTWPPEDHQIHVTEAVPYIGLARETPSAHPFAVDHSFLKSRREILNQQDHAIYSSLPGLHQRHPIITLGYWLVMPRAPLAPGEDIVDAMRQARSRELALLERAIAAGWLRGTRLITAVREEWGETRVRAYVVGPRVPIRQVMFPRNLWDPSAPDGPAVRLPPERDTGPVRGELH